MRQILITGAALGLFALAVAPVSAMPVVNIASATADDNASVVQVYYRRISLPGLFRTVPAHGMCIVTTTIMTITQCDGVTATTMVRATTAADMVVDIMVAAQASVSASAPVAGNPPFALNRLFAALSVLVLTRHIGRFASAQYSCPAPRS